MKSGRSSARSTPRLLSSIYMRRVSYRGPSNSRINHPPLPHYETARKVKRAGSLSWIDDLVWIGYITVTVPIQGISGASRYVPSSLFLQLRFLQIRMVCISPNVIPDTYWEKYWSSFAVHFWEFSSPSTIEITAFRRHMAANLLRADNWVGEPSKPKNWYSPVPSCAWTQRSAVHSFSRA